MIRWMSHKYSVAELQRWRFVYMVWTSAMVTICAVCLVIFIWRWNG